MNASQLPATAEFLESVFGTDVLNSLPDGLYITDRLRRIVFWNRAAERITGWSAAHVVGKTCHANILVHVDKDGHNLCGDGHCPLHRSIIVGAASEAPTLVFAQHRDGHRIPVEVSVSPVRNQVGEIVGGIESFRDLSGFQQDLLRAKRVQERALECIMPDNPAMDFRVLYQPNDLVGGDFYFVEPLEGTSNYVLMIADAIGHGVAAALNTMLLRAMWDEYRAFHHSPSALMACFNRHLNEVSNGDGYFGTAVAGIYEAHTGRFVFTRAGHPAPLVLRSASRTVEAIGESDPALGLFADAVFSEQEVILDVGDTLLLVTDGAEEAPLPSGNELGTDKLKELILHAADGVLGFLDIKTLEAEILRSAGAVRLPDDLTMLSLRRK